MNDSAIFDEQSTTITIKGVTKTKFLLKKKFQKPVLDEAIEKAKVLANNSQIERVWIIGSAVTQQLGKYDQDSKGRSDYSDVDLFVVLNCKMKEVNLQEVGLVKKLYTEHNKGKITSYYRFSIADGDTRPYKIMDRFSIDLWFLTPYTFPQVIRRFPDILDGAIKIK